MPYLQGKWLLHALIYSEITFVKKVLIISTSGLGDCLWATPGIRALKKSFPSIDIDILIQPQWKVLFVGNSHIREIITYKPQWYRQLILLPGFLGNHYDYVLIFHANRDIGRLLMFLRYSNILAHQNIPNVPSNQVLRFSKTAHPIYKRNALIERIGAKSNGPLMEIFLERNDHEEAISFLKQNQMDANEFIYLNIGASLPHKRWPIEKWVNLAKHILEKKKSFGIVFGGGPEEASMIKEIEKIFHSDRVAYVFNRSLRSNCALISQSRLMVTTDSGPMHIALATKTPTIAMFGPTRPEESGPYKISSQLYEVLESTVRDKASECKSNFFESITISMVWEKINLLLGR